MRSPKEAQRVDVWIVFTDEMELPFLWRFLRPGFRHCYALMKDKSNWLSFDPTGFGHEFGNHSHCLPSYDLPGWNERVLGNKAIKTTSILPVPFFPGLMTCVGNMKRVIGIRNPLVWTPYQLYRAIERRNLKLKNQGWEL